MKAIIFSQYARMVRLIHDHLLPILHDTKLFAITGQSKDKANLLNQFKQCPENAILISSDVLSQGQNIQEASYVINYDLPWNPDILDQRISRSHRQGQTQKVTVINLIVRDFDKIEQRVRAVIESKRKLQREVVI